jgi:hypothetical protein
MKAFVFAVMMGFLPLAVTAQEIGECDWRAAAQAIAEPWEANTRTFANGDIRLTIMDVMEPAAGPVHLMILSPPFEDGGRQCRVMSLQDTMGFANLTLEGAKAAYDPAIGLSVTLRARRWLPDTDSYTDATLTVMINQTTGTITGQLD